MEIEVCEAKRIVEVWLAKGETGGAGLPDLISRYNARGYLVALFRSGGEDLTDLTAGLLLYNRRKLASVRNRERA